MSATREMLRLVHAATKPMRTRISMMASRVVVNAIQDSPALQTATVEALAGELLDKIEHMQPGGLSHVAGKGAEGLMLCLGGSREAGIVFAVSNRAFRPKGEEGETILYAAEVDGVQARQKVGGPLEVTTGGATEADDFVAMAGKVHTEISNMLQAGVGAGGPGAANFTTAKTAWDLIAINPLIGVASTNLKADD